MSTLGLYFHTVRHLRPIQIATRAWREFQPSYADLRPAPPLRRPAIPYALPVPSEPSLLGPDTFRFLSVERRCPAAADWHPPDVTRLWAYNLHYFDDLNARDAPARVSWHRPLLERWVRENPPGAPVGWEPYPLSRRVVNWVKWAARGNALPASCRSSVAVQARWLSRRLEYQLLGNHLMVNAAALMHAGLYFEGPEAQAWYERGVALIDRQLREQVLADGGHFERSPMYHALVLEDLLDLINLMQACGREPAAAWYEAIDRMRRWHRLMSHPDGEIAFFNDATFGIAATAAQLESYGSRLSLGSPSADDAPLTVLGDSGYVRVTSPTAHLICDCAPVGPDYQPGHAHADTLSFELSLGRRRVLVNSGVSQYGEGTERLRQRGTAAHNCVILDGQDSSEVWGGFRVARRARARLGGAIISNAATIVEGSHDGYLRLPGRNRHTRRWTLDDGSLRIEDQISGTFGQAEARFHLHPDVDARVGAGGEVSLCTGEGELGTLAFEGASAVQVVPGTWHPSFGTALRNSCISVRLAHSSLISQLRWRDAR